MVMMESTIGWVDLATLEDVIESYIQIIKTGFAL